MQEGFDVLVGQVRNAIDLIKKLRHDKKTLGADLSEANLKIQGLETRLREVLAQLQQASSRSGEAETLGAQLQTLEQERLDVGRRVGKLTELLDSIDA